MNLDLWGCLRKGKTCIIAKFHRTVFLIICRHSGKGKIPAYSQINIVFANSTIFSFLALSTFIRRRLKLKISDGYYEQLLFFLAVINTTVLLLTMKNSGPSCSKL